MNLFPDLKRPNKENIKNALEYAGCNTIRLVICLVLAVGFIAAVIELGALIFTGKNYPFELFKMSTDTMLLLGKGIFFVLTVYFGICSFAYFNNAPPTQSYFYDDDDWWWE